MGVSRRAGCTLSICSHGIVPKRTNCALWRRRTFEGEASRNLLENRETHQVAYCCVLMKVSIPILIFLLYLLYACRL